MSLNNKKCILTKYFDLTNSIFVMTSEFDSLDKMVGDRSTDINCVINVYEQLNLANCIKFKKSKSIRKYYIRGLIKIVNKAERRKIKV